MGAVRRWSVFAFLAVGCAQAGERSIGDAYVRRLNEADCTRVANCGGAIGYEQCLGREWFYGGGGLARAIDIGDVVVDEDAFERCLAETAMCDSFFTRTEVCADAFIGRRTAGEPCEVFEECADGLFCGVPTGALCGVCAPQRPLGASCGQWNACAPTPTVPGRIVRCDFAPGTLAGQCAEFAVEPTRAPLGAPCSYIDETETFSRLVYCEEGLKCSAEGQCVPLDAAIGTSCRVGLFDCGIEFICADNGICVRPANVTAVDAPCDDRMSPGLAPRICDTFADLVCIEGRCRPFPTHEGEPCGLERCGPGLSCDFTGATTFVGVCVRPAPDGSYCIIDGMCASRFCNQHLLRCTQPVCD